MKVLLINKRVLLSILLVVIITFLTIIILTNSKLDVAASSELKISEENVLSEDVLNQISGLVNGEEKVAYLTFDDGPNPSVTPKVLDILKEKEVKATFFVIGKHVGSYPEIVNRAYNEGHYIANHGYNHNNDMLYKSSESFIDEIQKTDIAIGKAIGVENYSAHIFRFPNGYMAPAYSAEKKKAAALLPNINYTHIDWNSLNNDSMNRYNKSQLLENLKKTTKNKSTLVVLMHDTKDVSDSSTALAESIDYLKSLGYTFDNFYNITK